MRNVTEDWEQTHRDNLTRKGKIDLVFQYVDGNIAMVSDSRLISFNIRRSGDILSGFITQDTIVFTFDNFDGQFSYDPENDNYTGATIVPMYGFLKEDGTSYDSISVGIYFVTDVDAQNNKITFTAKSILAFMGSKFGDFIGTCSQAVVAVEAAAELDDYVPYSFIPISLDSS